MQQQSQGLVIHLGSCLSSRRRLCSSRGRIYSLPVPSLSRPGMAYRNPALHVAGGHSERPKRVPPGGLSLVYTPRGPTIRHSHIKMCQRIFHAKSNAIPPPDHGHAQKGTTTSHRRVGKGNWTLCHIRPIARHHAYCGIISEGDTGVHDRTESQPTYTARTCKDKPKSTFGVLNKICNGCGSAVAFSV